MDSLGTGLITTDMEGRIYLFNRAAEEITGYRTDDALRLTIWEVVPGNAAEDRFGAVRDFHDHAKMA